MNITIKATNSMLRLIVNTKLILAQVSSIWDTIALITNK